MEEKPVFVQANSNPANVTFYIISRAFESSLACQHFIFDWLGKLKSNKLLIGCQNELKGVVVEKERIQAVSFHFCACSRFFAASPLSGASDKAAMLRRLFQRKQDATELAYTSASWLWN